MHDAYSNASLHFVQDGGCCLVHSGDLSENLGLHELGGFDFIRHTTAKDYHGQLQDVDEWESSNSLFPGAPFHIFVNASTSQDVHYINGGSVVVEWWCDRFHVAKQDAATFALPTDLSCAQPCAL
jgi:hypothetical protein